MSEKLFHVGLKGLITNQEGKILLLKADVSGHKINTNAYWDIPGGRIQKGQTVNQALKREIKEETGISDIGIPKLMTTVISNHEIPINDAQTAGLVLMIYKLQIKNSAKIRISSEHTAYEWVASAVAAKRLAHKYPPEFCKAIAKL